MDCYTIQTHKVKIPDIKYDNNNLDKKVDVSNEKETIIQCRINKTDNTCNHNVTPNADREVYIDPSLTRWGIMDTLYPLYRPY